MGPGVPPVAVTVTGPADTGGVGDAAGVGVGVAVGVGIGDGVQVGNLNEPTRVFQAALEVAE